MEKRFVKVIYRHAESAHNTRYRAGREGRVGNNHPKIPLSVYGENQAFRAGNIALPELASLLEVDQSELEVVRVSASPAKRAKNTASLWEEGAEISLSVTEDRRLLELRKGWKWLGGFEGKLRRKVETPQYFEKRARLGWDYRFGTKISGGKTPREVATNVLAWINDEVPQATKPNAIAVDVAFGHAMSGRLGIGMALGKVDSQIAKLEKDLPMFNAAAYVLAQNAAGEWELKGHIVLEETKTR